MGFGGGGEGAANPWGGLIALNVLTPLESEDTLNSPQTPYPSQI
jgi:hypothetical protein